MQRLLSALFQPEHGGGNIIRAAGLLCADAGGLHQRFGQLFRRISAAAESSTCFATQPAPSTSKPSDTSTA